MSGTGAVTAGLATEVLTEDEGSDLPMQAIASALWKTRRR